MSDKDITKESSYHFLYSKVKLKGSVFDSSVKLILTEDKLCLIFLGKNLLGFPHVLVEKLIFLGTCLLSHLLSPRRRPCESVQLRPLWLRKPCCHSVEGQRNKQTSKTPSKSVFSGVCGGKRHIPTNHKSQE